MIATVFDSSFIDIIVDVLSEDHLYVEKLLQPGYTQRRSRITRIAGGNGVNVANTLQILGTDIRLVVLINELINQLLDKRGLKVDIAIDAVVNETDAPFMSELVMPFLPQ